MKQKADHSYVIKFTLPLLAILIAGCGSPRPVPVETQAVTRSTISATTNRILIIDPSSMPIGAGSATLTIGSLQRKDGVYSGDYKVNVFPYFFKNENGTLAIAVPDKILAEVNQGKVATIVGTATTSGKNGKSRHIDATATPRDINRGKLKLWFMAGDRKMIFEPAYHFSEKTIAAVPAKMTGTNLALNIK